MLYLLSLLYFLMMVSQWLGFYSDYRVGDFVYP